MKELDIASFAESLVTEQVTQGNPVQFAAAQAPDAPDISHIRVPDNFADQVLAESFEVEAPKTTKKVAPAKPINEAAMYKQHLVNEYEKKMEDLEDLIDLMESMGMMSAGAMTGSGMGLGTPSTGATKNKKKKRKGRASRYSK